MASSFFMLFDDIATLLDDVAVMTKVAAKKTAGVLGDDLALNANQVSGVSADRELPVVWAVAKGSMKNKAILVPAALLISAIAPWAITPMLMVGGLYLCFEGAEKIAHFLAHRKELENHEHDHVEAVADQNIDLVAFEKEKIKGAVQTDFILSAEIIVIALGSIPAATLTQRILVLVAVAIAMTVGVYGFVALIVKLDDYGMHLQAKASQIARSIGSAILWFAPWLMRALSYLGTAAMFLVGGSILLHGIPGLHHALQEYFPALPDLLFEAVTGLLAGVLCVLVYELYQRLKAPRQAKTQT